MWGENKAYTHIHSSERGQTDKQHTRDPESQHHVTIRAIATLHILDVTAATWERS